MPRPKNPDIAATMKAAAQRTGYPLWAISAAKAADCKAFRERGDVDCGILEAWFAAHPEVLEQAPEDGGEVNLAVETALDKQAARKLKEHKLSVLRREHIHRDEIRRLLNKSIFAMKSKLLANPRQIAMRMRLKFPALTEEMLQAFENESDALNVQALSEMSKGEWGDCKCGNCGKDL